MEENGKRRSLDATPTWAVATVITLMVSLSFMFQITLEKFGKWLDRTKRKSMLSALEKVKEAELMLFGLLSLLMGHWTIFVAKICVKESVLKTRFIPCAIEKNSGTVEHIFWLSSEYSNRTMLEENVNKGLHNYCPEGKESFASYESLEQLHSLLFVLGVTHVFYSFIAVALAMIKIYSWRIWESDAKTMATQSSDTPQNTLNIRLSRLGTFIFHHTSHPWSHHKILVWLLCFSRQFWSSINRADYMALRFGFITNHELPLTYDFHNYMLRSMDEEFRDIVGISVPLWIYAICCIILNFHGSNIYFWLSFLPSILILMIGTKLHRVVVKLAVEITSHCQDTRPLNLRDELFWFGKPKLLLRLIHLISFLNAFEMATFLWSLWEIKEASCFMKNRTFIMIRLSFGVISQVWGSFITFPLYVIITQMGSKMKKSVISENVRKSLSKWQGRVKNRQGSSLMHDYESFPSCEDYHHHNV
ncbi:PREDICTED: MLO-like protein 4 isoform X3 [Lupinus angustifolius]|uniref:MLO-like protein 4 isoform X3 n=1 Tax=Lupinus angustifolius TaxID=3871 RepID=UPI00092E8B0E|nr:PREDICTED: MLO-like protein 4 isoform X3 [Lupinus angustifolius]